MSNNLAKLSILAIVALSGYDMKLQLDPNDPITNAIKSQNTTPKNGSLNSNSSVASSPAGSITSGTAAASPTLQQSAYTTNAQNVIQNSKHLVKSTSVNAKGNFKAYVDILDKNGSTENGQEAIPVEKENTASNKKYLIGGAPKNAVVKNILDILLTQFVANKLALDNENEVSEFKKIIILKSIESK